MIRIVLDTNILVSGVFYGGAPYRILDAWREGIVQIVVSSEVLEEYRRVGQKLAARHPVIDFTAMLELLTWKTEMTGSAPIPTDACEDPDDIKFLACALGGKTKIIVSGDRHLLKASGFRGIQALKPREFVDACLNRKQED